MNKLGVCSIRDNFYIVLGKYHISLFIKNIIINYRIHLPFLKIDIILSNREVSNDESTKVCVLGGWGGLEGFRALLATIDYAKRSYPIFCYCCYCCCCCCC